MNKCLVMLAGLAVLALAGCNAPPAPAQQTSDASATQEQINAASNPISSFKVVPFPHLGY